MILIYSISKRALKVITELVKYINSPNIMRILSMSKPHEGGIRLWQLPDRSNDEQSNDDQ